MDLWSFKKPGPSILDEAPLPYMSAFLGYTAFAADLGIKTIRVDTVEPPDIFQTSKVDPKVGMERLINVWDKCSKIAADHGMNLTFEFEPGFAFNKPSEVLHIVEGVRAKGNTNFGVLYDTCHAHMCAAIGANQVGPKETLPGGALEMLQQAQGQDNSRPPDRLGRLAQRAPHEHAQPVRHRQARTSTSCCRRSTTPACPTIGGASICASGPRRGT